jgi:energy-coupling factor transport system permease protein
MITPTLDPAGDGFVHRAHPIGKLVWLVLVTTAATLSDDLMVQAALFAECLVVYGLVAVGKRSPPPPVFRVVLGTAALLLALNWLFAGSAIGRWSTHVPAGAVDSPLRRLASAAPPSLRIAITMLAFVSVTLSTIPRDLARSLATLAAPPWFTEPMAIAFRFATVFEINLRMLLRGVAIVNAHGQRTVSLRQRARNLRTVLVSLLVMALRQANITGLSLELRGFSIHSARTRYPGGRVNAASAVIVAIGVASLALALQRTYYTR